MHLQRPEQTRKGRPLQVCGGLTGPQTAVTIVSSLSTASTAVLRIPANVFSAVSLRRNS